MKKEILLRVLSVLVCLLLIPSVLYAEEAAGSLIQEDDSMKRCDWDAFTNVEITGIDPETLDDAQRAVLYQQARYCQAMTDADIDVLREIVAEDKVFVHMSGRRQSCEEYFADIANGRLRYFTIGIENPEITMDGDTAEITFTSVLNANAYGARGVFRMKGTHRYELREGVWTAVN